MKIEEIKTKEDALQCASYFADKITKYPDMSKIYLAKLINKIFELKDQGITYSDTMAEIRRRILETVSFASGVSILAMDVKTRKREVVMARYIYFYLLRLNNLASLNTASKIDKYKLDHATVNHGFKKICDMQDVRDNDTMVILTRIKESFDQNNIKFKVFYDKNDLKLSRGRLYEIYNDERESLKEADSSPQKITANEIVIKDNIMAKIA